MPRVICPITLSAERWLPYYQGAVRALVVRSLDGRSVQLPAHALRPFVDHDGLHGIFIVDFDESGRLQGLQRLPLPTRGA